MKPYTFIACAVSLVISAFQSQAAETIGKGTTLEAPCVSATPMYSGAHAGERACKDVIAEVKSNLKIETKKRVDARYEKCYYSFSKPPTGACRGTPAVGPVCNAPDSGIPQVFELPKGACSDSSPGWPRFKATKGGSRSAPKCNIEPYYTEQPIEDAYNAGAWVRAFDCYFPQVEKELDKNTIRLTNDVCVVAAKKYAELAQRLTQDANIRELANECCPSKNLAKARVSSSCNEAKVASACYLQSVRSSVEAIFNQIAICEVNMRAQTSWEKFLGSSIGENELASLARREINGVEGKGAQCNNDDPYIVSRYKAAVKAQIEKSVKKSWNVGVCN